MIFTHTCRLLALSAFLAGICSAQAPSQNSQSATDTKPAKVLKKVTRPPASIAAPRAAHLNTAQRVAASNKPPLIQLPAFTVADRDGKPVTAAGVAPAATHWFLLVREEDCLPCDRLMNGLAATENAALTGGVPYVIVVDGKNQDSVERVRGAFPALSQAKWLVDTKRQVMPALKARGTPMLYAMEGTRIAWQVAGTLAQPGLVEKMAGAWMTTKPLPSAATAAAAAAAATAAATSTPASSSGAATSTTTTTPPAHK